MSRTFSILQHVSAGENFRKLGLSSASTQAVSEFNFKHIFLSFRNLNVIVREWKLDGYTKPLDWYIYNNLIRPAAIIAPTEAAQILTVFKTWGGFFKAPEWQNITVDPAAWKMAGDSPKPNAWEKTKVPLKFFLPSEVVEAAFGNKMPQPVDEPAEQVANREDELAGMQATLEAMAKDCESFSYLEQLCSGDTD